MQLRLFDYVEKKHRVPYDDDKHIITLNKISVIIKVIYDIFQAEQKKFITCLQGKH